MIFLIHALIFFNGLGYKK